MNADDIDAAWVRQMGRVVGIELAEEQVPGVLANLRRTAQIAAPLLASPLSEQDELGPVWRP